jgi:xanthine dehydrogenase accessory factor
VRRDHPSVHRTVVTEADAVLAACTAALESETLCARVTVVSGSEIGRTALVAHDGSVVAGSLATTIADDVAADAVAIMERESNTTLSYGDLDVFFETLAPRPQLLVFGAVHIAQSLCVLARHLGYHVTVSDARPAFTTPERFPEADRLLVGWPDQIADQLSFDLRTFVVVLSHDARFEDPLWPLIHGRQVRYLGAMGSTRTAAARRGRLLDAGWTEEEVGRIHGPIGLDIGAETPGEVAVAILAEMTRDRYRSDVPLQTRGESRRINKGAP